MTCPTCGSEHAYRLSQNGMSIGDEHKTWEKWYCVKCGPHNVETTINKQTKRTLE